MTSTETIADIRRYFDLTHVDTPPWYSNALSRALIEYRTLKGSGHNKAQIVNVWKASNLLTPIQASAFVNAMEQIESGIPIQDPGESPSWSEAYDVGLGPLVSKIPWGTIVAVGLAYVFVTQALPSIAGNVTREYTRRKK